MTPEERDTPFNWNDTRAEPLGPPAAPISGPVVPYQPVQQFLPPPSAPNVTYVQPVARKGLSGPQAAVLIAVIVVVLPVLCCLGAMVLGMIGGGVPTAPATP